MLFNSKLYIALLCCLTLLYACNKKTKSHDEEEYMNQHHLEKAGRPSPPTNTISIIGNTKLAIYYSQPSVRGRDIWGGLVPYDKIWRTGANEATVFKITGDVLIEGDTIKAGKYALFTIPSENSWKVLLNEKYDSWGAYDYDEKYDVANFQVIPILVSEFEEKMKFTTDSTGLVEFAWEKLRFNFKVTPLNE